ncbi:hypothetical protein E5D57_008449 [Metarhizium anisopliae]|nr:hypothetical protein E5D57_008449 [Metarhizium anisopliae]
MEDIYRNLSSLDHWGRGYGPETCFQVTELWQNGSTGTVTTLTKKIDPINVDGWLAQETSSGAEGDAQALIVRMVWIDVDLSDKVIRQSEKTTSFLVNAFGLKLAYGYARSCVSGTAALPSHVHGENAQLQSFCFCYPPKIATVWACRRPRNGGPGRRTLTQGIFFAQEEEKNALQKALLGQWSLGVYRNPMFPSLLLALVIGAQIDLTTAVIKNDIRGVEKRTGYHNFASRQGEKRSEGDLEELLAKTSGSASKLASTSRKSKVLEKLLSFMRKTLEESEIGLQDLLPDAAPERPGSDGTNESPTGSSVLKSHVSVLQDRQEMQVTDIEYTLKRAQVQSDALFNIIQQYHANFNLELSRSTEQIAFFSYRDAASMKTLAVVTMFFLPGSFISALFSTNCFEWAGVDLRSGSIGVKPTPQMSLYWAITIPLTGLTFVLYVVWLAFQKRERDNMVKDQMRGRDGGDLRLDRSMVPESLEEAEDRKLARTRMTIDFGGPQLVR